jgi:large subunit ribosomal protein L3
MINSLLGIKLEQTQKFTSEGLRLPISKIQAGPCCVVQIKNEKTDKYNSLQLGIGFIKEKNTSKSVLGHIKKAGIKENPRFLGEIRVKLEDLPEGMKKGEIIKAGEVFRIGDIVNVTGTSKGKGFAGVVKRWHFKGGPRTHGQSDRERAPGSIGSTTTPGRVYKGKKMAGRMGNNRVTIKNLEVIGVDVENSILEVKGTVPGILGGLLIVEKVKDSKLPIEAVEAKVETEPAIEETAEVKPETEAVVKETEVEVTETVEKPEGEINETAN